MKTRLFKTLRTGPVLAGTFLALALVSNAEIITLIDTATRNGSFEQPGLAKSINGFDLPANDVPAWNNTSASAYADSGIANDSASEGGWCSFFKGSDGGAHNLTPRVVHTNDAFTLTWFARDSWQGSKQTVSLFTSTDGTYATATPVASVVDVVLTGGYVQYSLTYVATAADDSKTIGVMVDNTSTNFGGDNYMVFDNVILTVDDTGVPALPTILQNPTASSISVGGTATFTANATGIPAPTFQWQFSTDFATTWNDVPGATSPTLTLTAVPYSRNNQAFRMVATNSAGSTPTTEAYLMVSYPAPAITAQPTPDAGLAGGTVAFKVVATGVDPVNHPLTFQWSASTDGGVTWVDRPGATAPVLNLAGLTTGDAGLYKVTVSDPAGTADALPPTVVESRTVALQILAVPAPVEVISLSFVGAGFAGNPWGGSEEIALLAPTDAAGVLDSTHWNNSATVNDVATQLAPIALMDDDGDSSGATATWSSVETWAMDTTQGPVSAKTKDQVLLHGYIETRAGQGGGARVSIQAIPYAFYDVYVYVTGGASNNSGRGAVYLNSDTGNARHYRAPGTAGYAGFTDFSALTTAGAAQASPTTGSFVRFSGISGSQLTVNHYDTNSNSGGIAAIQIVQVTGSPYMVWAAGKGLTSANNGLAADVENGASGDGIPNLLEYILGGNPLASDTSILPAGSVSGSDLVFTYYRTDEAETGTTQTFEYGSDLGGWTPIPIGAESAAPVVVEENGSLPDKIIVTVSEGLATDGKLFGRLHATAP